MDDREKDEEFYGARFQELILAQESVLELIEAYRRKQKQEPGGDPVEHCKSRIKSPGSMRAKLSRSNLPLTGDAALSQLTDAVGIRIVCRFVEDVYTVADWIRHGSGLAVLTVKDYIAHPKPNGYRSLHIILRVTVQEGSTVPVEVQIRTIAQDCWASLEHQMKYKHHIADQKLIESELKRCASEIAATDISMQTIRELIQEGR